MNYFPLQIDKLIPKGNGFLNWEWSCFSGESWPRIRPPKSPKGDFDYVLLDCDNFFHSGEDECFEVSQRLVDFAYCSPLTRRFPPSGD